MRGEKLVAGLNNFTRKNSSKEIALEIWTRSTAYMIKMHTPSEYAAWSQAG
jgi:hypothetical protein